jgi:Asp-tRNA(Asn)/Glu-tRNA(Gln) amidotransferase C subunit
MTHTLTPENRQRLETILEAKLAQLSPEERQKFEHAINEVNSALDKMKATLDTTLAYFSQSLHHINLRRSLTDDAAAVFGSRKEALAWFTRPHQHLGNRTPLETLRHENGLFKVRQLLKRAV